MSAHGQRRWTPRELKLLAEHFRAYGPNWDGWDGVLPGRTSKSISNKAHKLGLRMDAAARSEKIKTRKRERVATFTAEDDNLLRATLLLAAKATGKGVGQIVRRAGELYASTLPKHADAKPAGPRG